jgi:hypothetical protein
MKDVKTMIKEEMEKYRDEDRQQEAGQCIMGEMRKDREDLSWKEKYNKEHKLRQEAEGELTIVKGISVHMSPEMRDAQKKITELQNSLDRFKKENNDCYNRIAEALEVNESHQKYNGKLQERLTELEEENKKMHDAINKKLDSARKAGM